MNGMKLYGTKEQKSNPAFFRAVHQTSHNMEKKSETVEISNGGRAVATACRLVQYYRTTTVKFSAREAGRPPARPQRARPARPTVRSKRAHAARLPPCPRSVR